MTARINQLHRRQSIGWIIAVPGRRSCESCGAPITGHQGWCPPCRYRHAVGRTHADIEAARAERDGDGTEFR